MHLYQKDSLSERTALEPSFIQIKWSLISPTSREHTEDPEPRYDVDSTKTEQLLPIKEKSVYNLLPSLDAENLIFETTDE